MPKLAIYIPKRDMRVIERWRKQVNFSQVFMTALLKEIKRRTRQTEADDDRVGAAADYYREQLLENDTSLVDFGFQVGTDRVLGCQLTPEQIQALGRMPGDAALDEEQTRLVEQSLGDDGEKLDRFADQHGVDTAFHPNWKSAVYDGYLQGVAAAWKQVSERI